MPSLSFSLFKFKGGVKPPTNKTQSVTLPVAVAPLPGKLIVPLHQSIGGTPRPIVQVGDPVLKGQKIGEADGWISAAVHAPTSGTVTAVAEFVQPHPSGLPALCVEIAPDGKDTWIERHPVDYHSLAPETVREKLRDAGVVGLGGAVFPSHAKLTASKTVAMDEIVINGAECEPYITCDDLLMRERAEEVVRGAGIFRDLLRPKRVLIGIEDNKPEAVAAMQAAVTALGSDFAEFSVIAVPTRYPAGGAKQLIRVLTGKEVPASKRSTDLGVQCFNVATAYTAWRAIAHGEPVISRLVTLTGNVAQPRNWEVLIGTPMDELLALAQPKPDTDGALMGGPMMGFLVPDMQAPIVKATNCLIAHSPSLFPEKPMEMPCIRCGECARACPHELQPFEMYWYSRAKNFGKAQEFNLFDCIECGCCSFVCPSRIPLVQYFRFSKSEIWAREREKKASESAKTRFEFKQFREEREKAEKAEKLAKAAAAQAAKKAAEAATATPAPQSAPATGSESTGADTAAAPASSSGPAADAKKAAIAAALERARAQRAAVKPQNTEQLTAAQSAEIAEIEARRTKATEAASTASHTSPGDNAKADTASS
jgi:electron transport complex protein RnfC